MRFDRETMLVATVFAAQIIVISFLVPGRLRRSYEWLFSRYPEPDYPRLYPVTHRQMVRQLARYRPIHGIVGIAGAVVLVLGLVFLKDPVQLARAMVLFSVLQFLPVVMRIPGQLRVARAFREMPAPSVRSIELKQWRVVDFVSPALVGLGLVGSALALTSAGLVYAQRAASPTLVIYAAVVNGALMLRMLYVLVGPRVWIRPDPYMVEADVFRVRQQRMRLLFGGAAVLGAYFAFMTIYATHRIPVGIVYLSMIVSVLVQALMLWIVSRVMRAMHARDFSVYRIDHATRPAAGGQ